jgi:hypothetical protein
MTARGFDGEHRALEGLRLTRADVISGLIVGVLLISIPVCSLLYRVW